MIWEIITSFIPGGWLAAGVALLGIIAAAVGYGKHKGAVRAGNQAAAKTAKAREAGRKGEAKAKADLTAGKSPEEIVRANDGRWEK